MVLIDHVGQFFIFYIRIARLYPYRVISGSLCGREVNGNIGGMNIFAVSIVEVQVYQIKIIYIHFLEAHYIVLIIGFLIGICHDLSAEGILTRRERIGRDRGGDRQRIADSAVKVNRHCCILSVCDFKFIDKTGLSKGICVCAYACNGHCRCQHSKGRDRNFLQIHGNVPPVFVFCQK